jgi:PKD repeat protein
MIIPSSFATFVLPQNGSAMKHFTFLIYLLLGLGMLQAQPESLTGIINRYAAVQGINYCDNSLLLSSTAGFSVGQAVLVIQMQGAEINISNSPAFGDISNLGSAGRYERGYIRSIDGARILLEKALINEYNLAGAVQVVSMPAYQEAIVTGTLTAQAWNGSTGGILAFSAGQLLLQGEIDLSGKGFRGGSFELNYTGTCTFLSSYNNYAYEEGSIRGGKKGEGISAAPASRSRGRGAQANGGGGGNDHNSGGGGGGHLGSGGTGGINDNPATFGCRGQFPGIGGKALPAGPERLYLGGGGGAGHGNNDLASSGGHGGGIVLIEAGLVVAQGGAIRTNGLDAGPATGDGAGGGGAGGTIALSGISPNLPGIPIEARGGRGGDANNINANQCFGPGGGGAGGRLLLAPGFLAQADLAGGEPGLSINSAQCAPSNNGAQAGQAGLQGPFAAILEGGENNVPPSTQVPMNSFTACQGSALQLPVLVQGFELRFRWQVDQGSGFVDLPPGPPYSQIDTRVLHIEPLSAAMGAYAFRLAVDTECFPTIFSEPLFVEVLLPPVAAFSADAAGLAVQFSNLSVGADSYTWAFGDGAASSAPSPSHSYPAFGDYQVQLIAQNGCGADTVIQDLLVGQPPAAAFAVQGASTGCAPYSLGFIDQSTGLYDSLLWAFPGGEPASSTASNPVVSYAAPGTYAVELRIFGPLGESVFLNPQAVSVLSRPEPDFDFSIDGFTASFFNATPDAESYVWNFGDGNTSTQAEPTHTYAAPGTYSVTLNAANGPCAKAISRTLVIMATSTQQAKLPAGANLFPNPFSSHLSLRAERQDWYPLRWQLHAADGRLIEQGIVRGDRDWALEWLPAGVYWMVFANEQGSWVGKVVKR